MDFLTLTGRKRNVPLTPYVIDWEADSLSKFQKGVKDFLRPYWQHDAVYEEFRIPGTRMSVDLLNLNERIAVEVQGRAHNSFSEHFHGGSLARFRDQLKRDIRKARWCELNDFTLVEVLPEDLPLTPAFFLDRYGITL